MPIFCKKMPLIQESLVTLRAVKTKKQENNNKKLKTNKWQQLEKSEAGDLPWSEFWPWVSSALLHKMVSVPVEVVLR
jgi:hypothetical protein